MSASKINQRLKRLAESNACSSEKASESSHELIVLAEKAMSEENASLKAKYFRALGDPTRIRMLGLLLVREMCVCEVMVALSLTQPTASHHLGILERVGLVKTRKEGKWVFYALNDPIQTANLLKFNHI
jgi:DNA-binding transcriptional ArsR family regulator